MNKRFSPTADLSKTTRASFFHSMRKKSWFDPPDLSKTVYDSKWTLDRTQGPLSKVVQLENFLADSEKAAKERNRNLRRNLSDLRERMSQYEFNAKEGRKTSLEENFESLLRKIKAINAQRVNCSSDVDVYCDGLYEQLGHHIASGKEMEARNTMIHDLCQKDVLPILAQAQKSVTEHLERFGRLNDIGSQTFSAAETTLLGAMDTFKAKKDKLSKRISLIEKKAVELYTAEGKDRARMYQGLFAIAAETGLKIDTIK